MEFGCENISLKNTEKQEEIISSKRNTSSHKNYVGDTMDSS